ncbi:MAG TPA: type III-B CRISPR module RAMP protein Cmr4 [Thermoanaerobaculia bacterium]|jgi:CRISPR-associated protein Cmr4|nr:type III-B CRISPR module RAMP protein Cmr4 [Thermoanaerobaculia bacterium]
MGTRLTLIHAMSPLHAGTGQSVGAIDLPIARERATGVPLIPGSSIKGALRARSADAQMTRDVFGPDTAASSEHSGSVQFSDAHLLLLPVRSVRGTFAWVTSSYLIRKFTRSAREAGLDLASLPEPPDANGCCVLNDTLTIEVGAGRKVVFEDLDFIVNTSQEARLRAFTVEVSKVLFPEGSADWPEWRTSLTDRICLIHDDMMSFLLDTATEVNAHIRLDNDTKTVAKGALWYQESLPAETVLAGIAVAADVKAANGRAKREAIELLDHVASLTDGFVQLGGKSTVGQGSCLVRVAKGAVP